ncbi:MAG: PKD domain-containing protein [Halarcobacter sp.]
MKKVFRFILIFYLFMDCFYASSLDEPKLDILLPTPKTYNYISDGSNITLIVSNGGNGILNVVNTESFYDSELNTTMSIELTYPMNWTGQGYEGIATKTNWRAMDIYYEGVRVIVTFTILKKYMYLDLYNKTIKSKIFALATFNVQGYDDTGYIRFINDTVSELTSSEYNSYLSNFDSVFNTIAVETDTDIPTNVQEQIYDDLLYNYSPIADAGLDQSIDESVTVTLDASSSSDSDGTIVSYEWKEGTTVLSTAQSFSKTDFTIGTHIIVLTVEDNDGATSTDTVTITINKVDTDNDGMSDEYENTNGLNPQVDDSQDDLDNDGKTNIQEYQDGTKPNDANSRVFTLNLKTGWNLVSLELNSNVDISSLNNSNIQTIRSLQNGVWKNWSKTSTTNTLTSLEDGYAYWIKVSQATPVNILGDGLADTITITPNQWNMIGSQTISDINQFFTDNPNVKVIWKYTNGQYQAISSDTDIQNDLDTKGIPSILSIKPNEGIFVK